MLLVIEGPDAVGKATQVSLVAEYMRRTGRTVETYAFPRYGTPLGKAILRHLKDEAFTREAQGAHPRAPEDPLIFQCAMTIDKYDAAPDIARRLQMGHDVICDRWWQSAYVYGVAEGLSPDWLRRIHGRLPEVDLSILLSVDAEAAERRRPGLRDRYEKNRVLQRDVFRGYHDLWRDNMVKGAKDGGHWAVVDGAGDIETVNARIMVEVRRRL